MNNEIKKIAIIGAGQAATQAVISLRQMGFARQISVFGDEGQNPYQRPPLSKAFMKGEMPKERLEFRGEDFWKAENTALFNDLAIEKIDAKGKKIRDSHGDWHVYDRLIIATGSRVRKLNIEGGNLGGVHYLKTIADSEKIGTELQSAKHLVIIGAGYIGLEVAAVARMKGIDVTIIELAPRILARVASPELSQFYHDFHTEKGVGIRCNQSAQKFNGDGRVSSIELNDGTILPADLVLIGIGILPNSEIAANAGIACSNGIDTNEFAQTSDENIYACGDCANRLVGTERLRLESVHNAIEQAKVAAAHIMGAPMPKLEIPWFWSDQYDLKLQIVGLWNDAISTVLRGDMAKNSFSVFHLDAENKILAIDAINSPPEFLVGKMLIAQNAKLDPAIIENSEISAKELSKHAIF